MQCPFCKGPHSASLCETIKDPKQRSDIVHQERFCFNSLGYHKVSSCNSKHRYHHCRRRHHTSSWSATTNHQPTTVTNITQETEQGSATSRPVSLQPVSLQPITPPVASQANTPSLSVTLPPQQKSVCLLKTTIATVSYGRRNAEAYVLLDEGSQRSFVTQDLARTLALQPSGQEAINISSFVCHPPDKPVT